ncbi:DUF3800 domain-containing protein [Phaeobacter sp. JH20_02]
MKPSTKYVLYVDESGDQDVKKFRTEERVRGSDPFLVFGACLVPVKFQDEIRQALTSFQCEIGVKQLHSTDLVHLKTAYFCRKVQSMRVLLFGLVSKKETLGSYTKQIADLKDTEAYYNKCAAYLLERLGHFMSQAGIGPEQVEIVFEEKKHDYKKLRNLIGTMQDTPHDDRARYLSRIAPHRIKAQAKKDEILLSLADLTAFSLYQSVSKLHSNFGYPEFRYMRELRPKFWNNPKGKKIANFGVKYIQGPFKMNLEGDALRFALSMYQDK